MSNEFRKLRLRLTLLYISSILSPQLLLSPLAYYSGLFSKAEFKQILLTPLGNFLLGISTLLAVSLSFIQVKSLNKKSESGNPSWSYLRKSGYLTVWGFLFLSVYLSLVSSWFLTYHRWKNFRRHRMATSGITSGADEIMGISESMQQQDRITDESILNVRNVLKDFRIRDI
jgi:hypothetical protein